MKTRLNPRITVASLLLIAFFLGIGMHISRVHTRCNTSALMLTASLAIESLNDTEFRDESGLFSSLDEILPLAFSPLVDIDRRILLFRQLKLLQSKSNGKLSKVADELLEKHQGLDDGRLTILEK